MFRKDRRLFDRFDVAFSAQIEHPFEEKQSSAQCMDVSASGCSVLSRQQFIPNTRLNLSLGIPDGHSPFKGRARVIWCRQVQQDKWHTGLEFETVDFMGLRRIFKNLGKKA